MPWRRWSVSRAALKAVTGQFVGRQTVLSAVILCALAAWFGTSTDLRVNPRIAVTGLVLAPVGLSATIASTWIGSGRWDDLARFPLRRDASALLFAVCVVAMLGCTDGLRVRRTQVGTVRSRRSLVLGELATVRTTQVNTLMMLVVGLVLTYTMARRGLTIPLPMAFVVVNTPLNAYFSRYLSTRTVVMAAPGSRRVLVAYARDLTLLYMTSNCLVGALIVWLGGGLVQVVAAGVVVSLAGASTAVLLEIYWPLTGWKSERDVMRHPRKYLPPAVALLAVMVVHALAP